MWASERQEAKGSQVGWIYLFQESSQIITVFSQHSFDLRLKLQTIKSAKTYLFHSIAYFGRTKWFRLLSKELLHASMHGWRSKKAYLNHRLVHKNLYHFISARFNFLCSFHMVKKKGVRVFVSKLWFRNSCIYIEIFLGVYMHGLTYHKPIHSQNPHLTTQHP